MFSPINNIFLDVAIFNETRAAPASDSNMPNFYAVPDNNIPLLYATPTPISTNDSVILICSSSIDITLVPIIL